MSIINKWNDITIKQRWIVFYATIFVLFFLSYKYNFKKTIDILTLYPELKTSMSARISKTESEKNITDIQKHQAVFDYDNTNFLNAVSEYTNEGQIIVQEVTKISVTEIKGITIETNKVVVEGTYLEIITFLYYIEYQKKIALISSAVIELVYDKTLDQYSLVATMYIKNILHEKDTN